jgi:hypothetical protein
MFNIDDVPEAFHKETCTQDNGATLERYFWCNGERYLFDFEVCTAAKGWIQYDTDQDAWYYGVWVNPEAREVVSYCEGDLSVTRCSTEAIFRAELAELAAFHGPPPKCATGIDSDGTVTYYYDTEHCEELGRPLPPALAEKGTD